MSRLRLTTTATIATLLLLLPAAPAAAAGGGGQSFCSNATKPDGIVIDGDLRTYANPGEVVSTQAPLPGNRGSGWGIQFICNPFRFG